MAERDEAPVRVRRSEMTTPAGNARMIESAALRSEADVVILDLEDATAQDRKQEARRVLVETAPGFEWDRSMLVVRVNEVGSPWWEEDLEQVVPALGGKLQAIVLPKVDSPDEIVQVDKVLERLEEEEAGVPVGSVALEALVESSQAVLRLEEIATASLRLEALIFGVADYAAAVGARLTEDVFTDYAYVKQRIVTVARAHGLAPIDCVSFRYQDLEQTRADAEQAARMGFEGKWCVHPAQVPVVNEAFTPPKQAVEWARRVVRGFEQAGKEGVGALEVDGEMVDMATVRVAAGILEKSRRAENTGVHSP